MTDETRWRTVSVHHHDESAQDDLILTAVRPLLAGLDGAVEAAYFLRHWRRGPHLRLNFRTTAGLMDRAVLPAVDATVGRYLREHPSTAAVDFEALLPRHRALARAEHDTGPLWPPHPDNTVRTGAHDSRAAVLGGEDAAALIAACHFAANPAVFAALAAARAERQRLWTAFDLMAATAHLFSGGRVEGGYVSFRAHADTFLARATDQDALRDRWDRLYRAARPALLARLDRTVTAPVATPPVRAWADAVLAVRDRAFALADAGALAMDHEPQPARGSTPFLTALAASEDFRLRMKPSAPFRHYRLVLNLLYLHLTRIGVRPWERYLLGHLVARTVEDAYGVDALTVARRQAAAMPGPA
jgi:Lantibiotic biosynthesis dehydratase C-term